MYELRDYDEPISANENCFEISLGQENRDGLAIRAMTEKLYKRPESNKLLMVLSDGAPCHGGTEYVGTMALEDTCKEIREHRKRGSIDILGLYVGDSVTTLQREKQMFGNDFVHIKKATSFAPQVIRLLKEKIKDRG